MMQQWIERTNKRNDRQKNKRNKRTKKKLMKYVGLSRRTFLIHYTIYFRSRHCHEHF